MNVLNSVNFFCCCYLFRYLRDVISIDTANARCYTTDQMPCRFFCHFEYGATQKTRNRNKILTVKGTAKL